MKRKMVLALLMSAVLASGSVFAEEFVASPTVADTTTAKIEVDTSAIEELAPALVETVKEMEIVVTEATETEVKVIEKISEVVKEDKPIAEVFGEETMQKVVEKIIPQDVAVEELKVSQIMPMSLDSFEIDEELLQTVNTTDEDGNEVVVPVSIASDIKYEANAVLVVMVGVLTGENDEAGDPVIEWYPLSASADEEGNVVVDFTLEVLQNMDEHEVLLTVLEGADEATDEAAEEQA